VLFVLKEKSTLEYWELLFKNKPPHYTPKALFLGVQAVVKFCQKGAPDAALTGGDGGIAWILICSALTLHVAGEALNGFCVSTFETRSRKRGK